MKKAAKKKSAKATKIKSIKTVPTEKEIHDFIRNSRKAPPVSDIDWIQKEQLKIARAIKHMGRSFSITANVLSVKATEWSAHRVYKGKTVLVPLPWAKLTKKPTIEQVRHQDKLLISSIYDADAVDAWIDSLDPVWLLNQVLD